MRHAACLIRQLPHYRHESFVRGLAAAGFEVTHQQKIPPAPGDVLVIWNRYGHWHRLATIYEQAGASVLVAENPYIGEPGEARRLYAIARNHHNGAGSWHVGREDRAAKQKIALKPWRESGEHILVLPQRGIGPDGVRMPDDWISRTLRKLKAATKRPIRLRPHPGNNPPLPLEPDLVNCHACVTWGSGAGIKALAAGYPVFSDFQRWIGAHAAGEGFELLDHPVIDSAVRAQVFHSLAWAQWDLHEIEAGIPFRLLLGDRAIAA